MAAQRVEFQKIVDQLPEVVWLLDGELSEILYTNSAYERLLANLAPNTNWPLDAEDLVHPEDTARATEWIETILADIRAGTWQDEYRFEARLTEHTGDDHWLETRGVPIVEEDTVVGFAGISSDITEHMLREQELESELNQLDKFVSMISHDIRNPLSVARANLEMYEETHEEDRLDKIDDALGRIEELTSDFVTLARNGSDSIDVEAVNLEVVATDAWDAIDTRDAVLETEPHPIDADPSLLQTVLENLFRNSVGHGGADVTIRVRPLEDGFFVEDTGTGISREIREAVMEHGFTTGYGGMGFGLTIVQKIAEEHGWQIELGESAEGGARFEFHEAV